MKDENFSDGKQKTLNENGDTAVKKYKKREKMLYKIVLYQIIVCITISVLVFVAKLFSYDYYYAINSSLKKAVKGETVRSFFHNIEYNLTEFLNNAKNASSNDVKNKSCCNFNEEEKIVKTDLESEINSFYSFHDEDDVTFVNFKLPLHGKISSKFGPRKNPVSKGKLAFHNGVDIVVGDGTPVFAVADGVVNKTANSEKSGKYLLIQHADAYESLYAHCSKIFVAPGSVVKKGDKIALSGHSGKVTGSHLHLGIKQNGRWINPTEIFPSLI